MKTLPRFAPLIAIVALFILVIIGGSALAHNNSTPQVESDPATMSQQPTSIIADPADDQETVSSSTSASETSTTSPASQESQPPQAPQVSQAPQVPLNYQYYDDAPNYSDDDWDDDLDDDWDYDGDDSWDDD